MFEHPLVVQLDSVLGQLGVVLLQMRLQLWDLLDGLLAVEYGTLQPLFGQGIVEFLLDLEDVSEDADLVFLLDLKDVFLDSLHHGEVFLGEGSELYFVVVVFSLNRKGLTSLLSWFFWSWVSSTYSPFFRTTNSSSRSLS